MNSITFIAAAVVGGACFGAIGAILLTITGLSLIDASYGGSGSHGETAFAWGWMLFFITVPAGAVAGGFCFAWLALSKENTAQLEISHTSVHKPAPEVMTGCPNCNLLIRADASMAGLDGSCPDCGAQFSFPNLHT